MISKIISILRFYIHNPGFFFRHIRKAFALVVTGDFRSLRNMGAQASEAIKNQSIEVTEQAKTEKRRKELLSLRSECAFHSPETILRLLTPYCNDLPVLAVVNDLQMQVRVIMAHVLLKFGLFDETFYRKKYLADVEGITAVDHYFTYGLAEGFWPNPYFNPVEYVIRNPAVVKSGLDPVIHYALFGYSEGLSSGSFFDHDFYASAYPDVEKSELPPFAHFLKIGRYENRKGLRNPPVRNGGHQDFDSGFLPRTRGTILIVSHDAEIGGAQKLIRNFAVWLNLTTQFDVKILCMRGGVDIASFQAIAPLFDFDGHVKALGREKAIDAVHEWAGQDIRLAFVNSVASGQFYTFWKHDTPSIAYIHELPKVIDHFGDCVSHIVKHADLVIGGSQIVRDSLIRKYKLPADQAGVVYNFIENQEGQSSIDARGKTAAKLKLGLNSGTHLIIGCGNVHWRKSPMVFIDVAAELLQKTSETFKFIWIGGGEDLKECVQYVSQKGLQDSVEFVGQQADIKPYCDAADVFLLPSEEDPFPLVCLYSAMSRNPTVCLKDAGGMPEFVANDCGISVPYMDIPAMTEAVATYMSDETLRMRHGEKARQNVQEHYTLKAKGPELLSLIRKVAKIPPKLSVIVPNYNYETYLPERWDSIINQTYQDFEVILLDDCSPDNSVELLKSYADARPDTRLVLNEENSGSPFRQWIKGIREARADLVWIAEADDFAEPELIETLLPYMEDRNVFLSYVKSVPVSSDGEIMGDYEPIYLNRINEGRWSYPYKCSDHEEVNQGLGIANCIPNASSVILRKFEPDTEFEKSVSDMRLCGDWFFYLRAISGGEIAYSNRPLNYHRRHDKTVTHSLEGSLKYFDELQTVRTYISDHYNQTSDVKHQIDNFITQDLDRFGVTEESERNRILSEASGRDGKVLPSLAVVVSDMSPGGGQVFAVTLANAWVRRGGRACLFNLGQLPDHPAVMMRVDPRLSYYELGRLSVPFPEMIRNFDLDIVHSSIWWADRFVEDSYDDFTPDIGWVVSMHGCIETILDDPKIDSSLPKRIPDMVGKVDHWAYTAEKNLKVFERFGKPDHISRVDNGMDVKSVKPLSRRELGVRPKSLLLCIATRAIESKGWFHAVEMVEKLNASGVATDLMLIGEGKAADVLRKRAPDHVHFYGQVSNLQDYIAASDIGLLPSYFEGESFPLVLLEMMGLGKPVIATDVGEIPYMIGAEDNSTAGGIIVPLKNGKPDVEAFVAAISTLKDGRKRKGLGKRALSRFELHFTIERMLDNFSMIYRDVMDRKGRV